MRESDLRILMVVRQFSPWVGGTERQAQKLSARLIELGLDVEVVTGWWNWGLPQHARVGTVPVFRNFTGWNLFGLRGLRKLAGYMYMGSLFWHLWVYRGHYDIIHVHLLSYPAWVAVLAGRCFGKPTLVKVANSGRRSDLRRMRQNDMLPGQRQMLPLALRADRLVVLSQESYAELLEAGVPAERIVRIPNGVNLTSSSSRSYRLGGHVNIVFLGRLHSSKGLETLEQALALVIKSRPSLNWQLWLVGDGPQRAALTRLAEQLGIASAVKFCGQVEAVETYLARADLFVLPSLAEGMSNALLEAMAWGLPCIATSIGGNRELVQDGVTGLLVPPEREAELAAALERLVDDERLRERLGCEARRLIEAEFSVEVVARRYVALYRTLLGMPPAQTNEKGPYDGQDRQDP